MSSPSPRPSDGSSLSELQALLFESDTLHHFLDRLAAFTAQALPEGSSCGVTVRQNSRAVTLAASDEQALRIDQLQYDLDEGPCLETLATGKSHYIVDTATETHSLLGRARAGSALVSGAAAEWSYRADGRLQPLLDVA